MTKMRTIEDKVRINLKIGLTGITLFCRTKVSARQVLFYRKNYNIK